MDHSVQAYLERLPSAKLMDFLEMCTLGNEWGRYADTVPDVFTILQKRNIPIPERITNSWKEFVG